MTALSADAALASLALFGVALTLGKWREDRRLRRQAAAEDADRAGRWQPAR